MHIQMDFREQVLWHILGTLERIHDALRIGIEEGIHDRVKLIEEFLEIMHQKLFIELLDFFIAQAVQRIRIADHREQVELFRIDFLEQQRAVRL